MPLTPGSLLREPRPPDAPARVWRDWALAAAVIVGALLEVSLRNDLTWAPVAFAAAVFVVWPIMIRRSRPLLATALAFVPTPTLTAVGVLVTGEPVGLYATAGVMTVTYSLTRWGSGAEIGRGLVILLYAWLVGTVAEAVSIGDVVGGFIFIAGVLELGALVRVQARSLREGMDQARMLEREKIARELHDTVAHHVSAIAVQAQAGRAVAALRPQDAIDTLAIIEEAASRTLSEMRSMVGGLRGDTDVPDRSPQRGVAAIAGLAETFDAGAPVIRVSMSGPVDRVGPTVGAALYRLAQESVTNAVRHARQATRVDVELVADADEVHLTVSDDGRVADGPRGNGYGLVGMAERAALLGGAMSAGPRTGRHGWQVTATLPLRGGRP